jgi:hypothetical protein
MKKRAPPKLHTRQQRQREEERQFKPLALKIGWIAYEWNRLQETLAELFADAMGNHSPAFKVWHSVRSDLTQREMLKAAAEDKMAFGAESLKRVWGEILWVTNEATALSHKLNDALHAPFFFVTHPDKIEVLPLHIFGNQKAKKLLSKDILKEFEWYKNSLAVLADYAMILHYGVRYGADNRSRNRALLAWYRAAGRLLSEPCMMAVPSAVHTHHLHFRPRFLMAISKVGKSIWHSEGLQGII